MTNIKNVVKVMNFHALLRVEKSKRVAESQFELEKKLRKLFCEIYYNNNLILDKKFIYDNPNGTVINIYIGNDLGFCSNFNSLVHKVMTKDKTSSKVLIGKKIFSIDDNTLMMITKDNFDSEFFKLQEMMTAYIKEKKLKEVNVIYNHYYNVSDIKFMTKRIFPIVLEKEEDLNLDIDYLAETDINKVLSSLIGYFICHQIKICVTNSFASENLMRERITSEAKTKIEKINEEEFKKQHKEKKYKQMKKDMENYRKED